MTTERTIWRLVEKQFCGYKPPDPWCADYENPATPLHSDTCYMHNSEITI